METITNHCPDLKVSLFLPVLVLAKWILWLWVKEGGEFDVFCISLLEPCVCLAQGPQKSAKNRRGRVTTSIRRYKGLNWHRLLACTQCMLGWQCPRASWQRYKQLGVEPASQWGHRKRREGDKIRSRGENWDRFSCRCWDNRRTNDLIVGARIKDWSPSDGSGGRGSEITEKAGFELQRQSRWHMLS